jgi:hypothetical protein
MSMNILVKNPRSMPFSAVGRHTHNLAPTWQIYSSPSANLRNQHQHIYIYIYIYIYIFQLSFLKQRGSQEDYRKLKLAPQLADHMGIIPDGQNQKAQLKLGIAIQRTFLVG